MGGSDRRGARGANPTVLVGPECGGYSPVAPSIASRIRSVWPLWRAHSSIKCRCSVCGSTRTRRTVEGVVQTVPCSDRVDRGPLVEQLLVVLGSSVGVEPAPLVVIEVEVRDVLTCDAVAPPVAFHLSHMTHDPEQRHVRGWDRVAHQLPAGQPRHLPQQGLAVPGDEPLEAIPLGQVERELLPGHLRGCPRHGSIVAHVPHASTASSGLSRRHRGASRRPELPHGARSSQRIPARRDVGAMRRAAQSDSLIVADTLTSAPGGK